MPVQLTAAQTAGIFSGKYATWGDVGTNVNATDALLPITIVVRGDGSGSTGDFTEYLSTFPGLTGRYQVMGAFTPAHGKLHTPVLLLTLII